MPRLILLNGPPACGKSTVGRLYVEDHRLALDLDIDHVRGMLGGWRDDPASAGIRARAISLAAARVHLLAGYDVIVPQLIARVEFLDQLLELAASVGADFYEIVLMSPLADCWRRIGERTSTVEAAEPVTHELLTAYYDRLAARIEARPPLAVIQTADGDPAGTHRRVLAFLSTVDSA